jgi:hypothetical protein
MMNISSPNAGVEQASQDPSLQVDWTHHVIDPNTMIERWKIER